MDDSWDSIKGLLSECLWKAVLDLGFAKMTPVQAACIPRMLNYQDIAAEAITGSGKTLSFLVPTLQIIHRREEPIRKYDIYAIIVSPTRELAVQIHEVLQQLLKYSPQITSMLLVGGTSVNQDLKNFEKNGCHIVIGTPGRICDAFTQTRRSLVSMALACKQLEMLILDEADRLLELGFSEDINSILAHLPKQRRTGLFSATQTSDVIHLIRAGLRNPVQIKVRQDSSLLTNSRTPSQLSNYYMICDIDKKFATLITLLKERKDQKILVFFATCACVDYFNKVMVDLLPKANVLPIHGKMKNRRNRIFEQFRKLENGILVCTDLMCRGIDIPEVDWVIQFDPPSQAESFIHRCGRTARAGSSGSAILMLLPEEVDYVKFIELNQKVDLKLMEPPENVPNLVKKIRKIQLRDRDFMDKANVAFVSFVQFYKKHECTVLFKVANLNLSLMAMGYGLLKLPKMPELKHVNKSDFIPHEIDHNEIPYKDKQREESRQKKLEIYKQTGVWPANRKKKVVKQQQTVAWSKNKDKKEKKKLKNEKKIQKREARFTAEDLQDFEEDEKMFKKLKKRKISKEDFDKFMGCGEEENKEEGKENAV